MKSENDRTAKKATDREILELRVDTKLNEAKEDLRKFVDGELQRISEEKHRPKLKRVMNASGVIIALLVVSNIIAWLGVTERAKRAAEDLFDKKVIQPELSKTLDEALVKQAVPFIKKELHPIETNISVLETRLQNQKEAFQKTVSDVSSQQTALDHQQKTVLRQQHVQDLLVAAKGGSLSAYHELKALSGQTNSFASIARAASADIDLFFDSYRYRSHGTFRIADEVSLEHTDRPIDTLLLILGNEEPGKREFAALSLGVAKKANTVEHIYDAIIKETNAFALACLSRTFYELTGRSYGYPLDVLAIKRYWAKDSLEKRYQSPYRTALRHLGSPVPKATLQEAIRDLSKTLDAEPEAWSSRCLRGACYSELGDLEHAESDFAEVEKGMPSYGPLYFYKAQFYFRQGKRDKTVEAINKGFELKWHSFEGQLRKLFPEDLLNDPRIKWPSAATNSVVAK
jgi:tetratricopeptide (TPR) repeat protein